MTSEMITSIVIAFISVGGTALITAIISETVKSVKSKKSKKHEELENYRDEHQKQETLDAVSKILQKEIESSLWKSTKELKQSITDLQFQTEALAWKVTVVEDWQMKQTEVLRDSRRNEIKKAFELCVAKGYRTEWDTENLHHLHDGYKKMNGNSFIEKLMEDFDDLPLQEDPQLVKQENK